MCVEVGHVDAEIEARAEGGSPQKRDHRLYGERAQDRNPVRLEVQSPPELFEALEQERSRRWTGLLGPQPGKGTGRRQRVSGRDEAIDFLAGFETIHGFSRSFLRAQPWPFQVFDQQLLAGVHPGNAAPAKRYRRQRVLHDQAAGRTALFQLSVERIDFVTDVVQSSALHHELAKRRILPRRLDQLDGWSVGASTPHKGHRGLLQRVMDDLPVPRRANRVREILAQFGDRSNHVSDMVETRGSRPGRLPEAASMVLCKTSTKRCAITDQSYLRAVAAAAAS